MLFLCLIVICLYLNEFTLAFTPTNTVWGHSAVFADSRIYITGGIIPKNPIGFEGSTRSKEFYYLDVEKPFGVGTGDKLPWVDLNSEAQILPEHAWSAFSNCGQDDTLILFPGEYNDPNLEDPTVYTYKLSLRQWNSFTTANPPSLNYHSQTQTVCDVRTGTMYIFGGIRPKPDTTNKFMNILDTSTLVWQNISIDFARFDHTGTLLPNGNIIYIGGSLPDGKGFAEMSELLLYNTNNNTWTSMNAIGNPPTPRAYHSAVLTQDGRIIVYGGLTKEGGPAKDDLVILDTSQADYTWSKAYVSTNSPLSRYYHTATLVGYYMIVAFGKNDIKLPLPTSNEVFILDTHDKSNYKWITEFDPDLNIYKNLNKNLSTQTKNLTIGIIILSIVLALIGASFLIYFYRKRRLSRPDMLVPSSQDLSQSQDVLSSQEAN
ncbi:galactose oxidase [Rhizophagus irregularis]|uniref:Galactose oxidase n=3 Tax=Rhizophagus irregularis TaxID=588596 RepID=A0A2I1DVI2_9GLOM|nr:hypothetical protein GLOIN_2v1641931 [Rhizophagus irregularis DAOM 181602=DAOM 197198]EXX71597.1 hypothetical protein RirG_077030 [Rhizophagus irregularis DAOM 197198w]PKC73005.1 galactose oxidase [Rhizophagus irregularis]PKK75048.1 galactose oxidase [Rhizophagus irregularis]PKY13859.1 galactose oxidase [Rhizophagus irregularis]POG67980.1 hypothetical protein GLOIN_2v1641931 [Rhizophagus irregularis DAOM 181602=DAOM 197198]|eukprot:XP_025174846.1 hypothetical protein GLOIN_2v1641931 [Rhizophagus irregularis DAOM 181602=DAOM 197198]